MEAGLPTEFYKTYIFYRSPWLSILLFCDIKLYFKFKMLGWVVYRTGILKVPSGVSVRFLYQPGELEGGRRRATDPVWSLDVYRLGHLVTKPDWPPRGFVREELLVVPCPPPAPHLPPPHLPPDGVLKRWTAPLCTYSLLEWRSFAQRLGCQFHFLRSKRLLSKSERDTLFRWCP